VTEQVRERAQSDNEVANSIDLNFLREQAEKGDVNAQWMLAGLHAAGKRVPQDDVEAAKWYRRAAEQGSQMMLAVLYFGGVGVPKDMSCVYVDDNRRQRRPGSHQRTS
jgi:TPR repeat protein